MSYFGRFRKDVIRQVAEELVENVPDGARIAELKELIRNSEGYDEEMVIGLLQTFKEEQDRQDREQERERERETQREEREREIQREEREREFELEKLRITSSHQSRQSTSSPEGNVRSAVRMHHIMDRFKGEQDDITNFLNVFEGHARNLEIPEEEWVVSIMGLLPNNINSWITLEQKNRTLDYTEIKEQLLNIFKFNPEKFRQLFLTHQKRSESTWNLFARELSSYCKEWIGGLQLTTFEQVVDLIITDQLKRRVPQDIRESMMDAWGDMVSPLVLARKLDQYENNRASFKKKSVSHPPKDKAGNTSPSLGRKVLKPKELGKQQAEFERPYRLKCYRCGSEEHLRRNCPTRRDDSQKAFHVSALGTDTLLAPHTSTGA